MELKKTKLVLYSNTLKSVIELILRFWFVNSRLGFWVIILKDGYMVHLSVFGQPWLAPQQQLEKKWSGARASGGLKREKANRPITTNCTWKEEESVLSHKHANEGGCFSSEKNAGNSFLAGFTSFCSLAEPAVYIISDHQGPNSTASFTWSEFPFHAPGARRVGDLDPGNQLFVFKGQCRTKLFLK